MLDMVSRVDGGIWWFKDSLNEDWVEAILKSHRKLSCSEIRYDWLGWMDWYTDLSFCCVHLRLLRVHLLGTGRNFQLYISRDA